MTDLSISIVSYHTPEKVRRLLGTILEYTKGVSYHVYVIDNGAPDHDTAALASEFPADLVSFRTMENLGFGAGHNLCLPELDSEFHAVVNPDIELRTDVFTELITFLREHPEASLVTPQIHNEDGTEQFLPRRSPTLKYLVLGRLSGKIKAFQKYRDEYTMKGEDFSEPVEIQFCTGCFMVTRTALYRGIGGFDDGYFMYFEDTDLTERLAEHGKVLLLHDYYVIHDWEGGSRTSKKLLKIHIQSMFRYFRQRRKKKKAARKARKQ